MKRTYVVVLWVAMSTAALAQGSWQLIAQLPPRINDIFFLDRDRGWITDGPLLLGTTDGGMSWDTLYRSDDSNGLTLARVFFVDTLTGWAWVPGYRGPSRTDDGGRTWRDQTATIPHEPPGGGDPVGINDCFFIDKDTGWAVGNYLSILATTDGGEHWKLRSVDWNDRGYFIRFDDVEFSDPMHAIAVGGNQIGAFARSSDGGATWLGDLTVESAGGGLTSIISMPDARHGFAPEYGLSKLWQTDDGGATWAWAAVEGASEIMDAVFTDSLHGWMLDRTHTPGPGTNVLSSNDGGKTWRVAHTAVGRYLDYLSFPAADVGYAAGYSGMVWKYQAASEVLEEIRSDNGTIETTAEPNPAGDRAQISFHLLKPVHVRIVLYDLFGRPASTISDAELGAGRHRLEFPTADLPSGPYRYQIESGAQHGGGILLVRH